MCGRRRRSFSPFCAEQTERLTQMTKTLLEMSNLQQVARNEQQLQPPMVEEIFTDLAPLAEKRSITLEAEGDAALTGSDALIYRLLFNLTENAVKYNRPAARCGSSLRRGRKKCIIRVSDTGCGIPEEYQRSIFQPFFRVDKSRSREYGGAGLGPSLWGGDRQSPRRLRLGGGKLGQGHDHRGRSCRQGRKAILRRGYPIAVLGGFMMIVFQPPQRYRSSSRSAPCRG